MIEMKRLEIVIKFYSNLLSKQLNNHLLILILPYSHLQCTRTQQRLIWSCQCHKKEESKVILAR